MVFPVPFGVTCRPLFSSQHFGFRSLQRVDKDSHFPLSSSTASSTELLAVPCKNFQGFRLELMCRCLERSQSPLAACSSTRLLEN